MSKTGRFEKVEIRAHWPNEEQHFTPWMVDEGGLEILAEALGLKLESPEQEVSVGPFRADILCRNAADGSDVLIENQYGVSNHDHIGKLLTYSADLATHTVVWIAEEFHEKHRKALNHLNRITNDRFQYFAVKVSLWRIGDSEPAPRFEIVCKPSGWEHSTPSFDIENLSDTEKLRINYWTALRDHTTKNGSFINFRKIKPSPYLDCQIRDKFGISAHLLTRNEIGVSLFMVGENAIERFDLLKRQGEDIQNELETALEWENSRVYLPKNDTDPRKKAEWENQHEWLMSKLESFDRVFRPRIKIINDNWKNKVESQTDRPNIPTDIENPPHVRDFS